MFYTWRLVKRKIFLDKFFLDSEKSSIEAFFLFLLQDPDRDLDALPAQRIIGFF